MSTPRQQQGGLSLQTLVIASVASVAAAVFVHKLWKGGAIIGAAFTPIIVAIVSESLKKPVERVTTLRERTGGTDAYGGRSQAEVEQADRFGIWQEEKRPWYRRRSTKVAFVTGVIAFVIGAFALTASEIVFGGSVGGGNDRLTLPVGGQKERSPEARTTETQPPDAETTPAETTPTTPTEEQVPPTETAPPTQTAPTTPVTPAPTEPAPTPTETTPPPDPAAPTP